MDDLSSDLTLEESLGRPSPLLSEKGVVFTAFNAMLNDWDCGPGVGQAEEACNPLPLPLCLNGGHCSRLTDPSHSLQFLHPVSCSYKDACNQLHNSDHTFFFVHSEVQRAQSRLNQSENFYPEQDDVNQDPMEEAIFSVLGAHPVKVMQGLSGLKRLSSLSPTSPSAPSGGPSPTTTISEAVSSDPLPCLGYSSNGSPLPDPHLLQLEQEVEAMLSERCYALPEK